MDTLTIEIRNPKVKALIDNLVSLDLITVVPTPSSWRERWQALSATLPNMNDLTEDDILSEIQAMRQSRAGQS